MDMYLPSTCSPSTIVISSAFTFTVLECCLFMFIVCAEFTEELSAYHVTHIFRVALPHRNAIPFCYLTDLVIRDKGIPD